MGGTGQLLLAEGGGYRSITASGGRGVAKSKKYICSAKFRILTPNRLTFSTWPALVGEWGVQTSITASGGTGQLLLVGVQVNY